MDRKRTLWTFLDVPPPAETKIEVLEILDASSAHREDWKYRVRWMCCDQPGVRAHKSIQRRIREGVMHCKACAQKHKAAMPNTVRMMVSGPIRKEWPIYSATWMPSQTSTPFPGDDRWM